MTIKKLDQESVCVSKLIRSLLKEFDLEFLSKKSHEDTVCSARSLGDKKKYLDIVCKLIELEVKLKKIETTNPQGVEKVIQDVDFQSLYLYFVEKYEKEELYRKRLCVKCGHKQDFLDHLPIKGASNLGFKDYIKSIKI
jgi:hypothetical protein